MRTGFGGTLGILGFIGCSLALSLIPASPANGTKRLGLLAGAAFSQGTSLGPLINVAFYLYPGAAALLARRRSYLYLGGILSSAMSLFITMRFATWFVGGGAALFQAELYGGLLIFAGYVVFDTQLAIEKAESGRGDVISTALDLFVDLVAIFVRLLVILMKNAQSKDEERDRRRPRAGRWARRSEL
ncbi:hypothetical protein QBZ16_002975 [Prototheca wickerhamii]|uniref:Bax inhibitor 1 n=1 Tax=Prototheca wickerhamii TaxID=3111 RepID=A0AAD9ILE5_PROWI|nr:hypothetical protein QBZ16_002975 [Prototheca wickerhamii]